jgi:alpha-D-ribose 1-methylphosphonate 5-triphosphate synthase subunit PhnL
MHSDVDASIIEALDEAIELVESENTEQSRKAALQMVGNFLRLIPAIKALYEELTK